MTKRRNSVVIIFTILCAAMIAVVAYPMDFMPRSLNGPLELELERIKGGASVDEVRILVPELSLRCQTPSAPHGELNCSASLSSWNGIVGARSVAFQFRDDRLDRVRVSVISAAYDTIEDVLVERFGAPTVFSDHPYGIGRPAAGWVLPAAVVILTPGTVKREAFVDWVSLSAFYRQATI